MQDVDERWHQAQNEVTWLSDYVITSGHMLDWKHNIFSSTKPMNIKIGKVMTYGDKKTLTKSHDPLTTKSLTSREKFKT